MANLTEKGESLSNPIFAKAAASCLIASLAGCTTLGGESILRQAGHPSQGRTSIISSGWTVAEALNAFYAETNLAKRRDIRDRVIGMYLAEENARFNEYKSAIRVDMGPGNFLLDSLSLGLSSAASVAGKKTANALSAAAAGTTGVRSSFNKNVYYEQTMNALLSQMTTGHDAMATNIRLRMERESADTYPLPSFFDDLARLEGTGTLEQALQKVAGEAARNAEEEERRFEVEFVSGVPDVEAITVRDDLRTYLSELLPTLPKNSEWLKGGAVAIGAKPGGTNDDTVQNIRRQFLQITDREESLALLNKLKAAIAALQAAALPPPK